jgi:23S rRNA pseudouridine1911/1915/1917 synthase
MKIFLINKKDASQRLDVYLVLKLKNISRNQAQKIIRSGRALINEQTTTPHYFLKEGDMVKILEEKNKEENIASRELKLPLPEIIEDNKEYLIINKPSGLAAHGGSGGKIRTLADFLIAEYPDFKKIGEDPARPAIVHRLDKEVSGLMVIPKTQASFDNLKKQFQERKINKEYLGLVYGKISEESGIINFPIERSKNGRMAALPKIFKGEKTIFGRTAITEFKILKKFINFTFLKIKIKTGRTHQIRTHLLAYGHPLVGDNLYSTRMTKIKNKKLNLGRVFLVAAKLGFKNLAGEKKEYNTELPPELKKLLNKVK